MRIKPDELKQAAIEILTGLGENEEKSRLVADSLVKADMRGITTHGTYLLVPLKERTEAEMMNIPTELSVVNDEGAITHLDGGNGIGLIAAREAMERSVEKAKKYGIGFSLLRNTNTVGFLGYYTNQIANEGMVGFAGTNAAPAMAPFGGAESFFGTNPMSYAIPTGQERPIVLDMSSTIVARGKIRQAARNNEDIPEEWAFDADGENTTNPEEALEGCLLPVCGPKGSGLAMIVDILAGLISGSKYAPYVKSFHDLEGETGVGFYCIAIDIEKFQDRDKFNSLMANYIETFRNIKKVKSVSEIYLPGEIEFMKEDESAKKGVEINENVIEKLNDILAYVGSTLSLG